MKRIITIFTVIALLLTSTLAFAAFPDIDSSTLSWAGEAIDRLVSADVISGYPDGTFAPAGNVTRAEFAKMLSLAFGTSEKDSHYTDISGHWAEKYINSVSMYASDDKFRPDEYATRADVAYAVVSLVGENRENSDILNKFSDCSALTEALKESFAAAVELGIIKGYEDATARPYGNVTRSEAAVIICRSLDLKADENEDKTENTIPSDGENEADNKPIPTPEPEDTNTANGDKDHIYTLYPGADFLLITSISASSTADGEDMYRISYRLATDETEYSSLIPEDTVVSGLKTEVSKLRPGDVITMNTAFHGYIGNLYVHASFGEGTPVFDGEITEYNKGKYTIKSGKITNVSFSGKNAILSLDTGAGKEDVMVLKKTDVNVFSPWKKNNKWWFDSVDYIDIETEDVYVYIRYTNGISTEILVSDINR